MTFEQKTELGLLGENLVHTILLRDQTLEVRLNTGPGFVKSGYGVSYWTQAGRRIVPDLDIRRKQLIDNGPFCHFRDSFGEVKTKAFFAFCETAQDVRTGINLDVFNKYIYTNLAAPRPFDFYFVQVLPRIQDRKNILEDYQPQPISGIYKASIEALYKHHIKEADKVKSAEELIYWSFGNNTPFQLTNTMAELAESKDTKSLVLQLRESVFKSSKLFK